MISNSAGSEFIKAFLTFPFQFLSSFAEDFAELLIVLLIILKTASKYNTPHEALFSPGGDSSDAIC